MSLLEGWRQVPEARESPAGGRGDSQSSRGRFVLAEAQRDGAAPWAQDETLGEGTQAHSLRGELRPRAASPGTVHPKGPTPALLSGTFSTITPRVIFQMPQGKRLAPRVGLEATTGPEA